MVTRAEALGMGLTHEGSVCGAPCWMSGVDSNTPRIVLKDPALLPWVEMWDDCYEGLAALLPAWAVLQFPISAGTVLR